MNRLSHTSRRWAATLLLVFFVASYLVMPVQRARAQLLVYDVSLNPKEYALDLLAYTAKLVIREFRNQVISWIKTGRFGTMPAFSASIMIDSQRIMENAAKIFLSELTGINFCSSFPRLPSASYTRLDFRLSLACTYSGTSGGSQEQFYNGDVGDFVSLWSSEESENDFWNSQVEVMDEKMREEAIAANSLTNEFVAGSGFLNLRDPKTGKTKTPGKVVADYLQEDINSMFREYDLADEMTEVIIAIADTFLQTIITQGLGSF